MFAEVGDVESIELFRTRERSSWKPTPNGTGTVTYVEDTQADKAVTELDMREVNGHAVTVKAQRLPNAECIEDPINFALAMTSVPDKD